MEKILRSICVFAEKASTKEIALLDSLAHLFHDHQFSTQTQRICLSMYQQALDEKELAKTGILIGFGSQSWQTFQNYLPHFITTKDKNITLDLTHEDITLQHIEPLFQIIENNAKNTFTFSFGFNLPPSSPFFPSALFGKKGFSIGLQATDLSDGCSSLEQWFAAMKRTWDEIDALARPVEGYLGIDSSVAPLFSGKSSFVNFIKRLGLDFSHSVIMDVYTRTAAFIKKENPRPVGLCGLMFPCLEDFELAEEYENGNFTIERNLFLSLHSGLGIDVYPIGIDQDRHTVVGIARLVQQLSNKYQKPLAIRFVSDGKARIGETSNFANQYLKDVVIRAL
jgi:hypothetical protein